ncbi:hypothetical protein [Acinetobacter soli]|uniref:hypothetical protein n=1 Tax=Acinetobacter soli TaxID=487316 RepID=UPI001230658B|nr:hypothetical protein [Acinetobacter soli]
MYLLDEFKKLDFSSQFSLVTVAIFLIGFFYKIGFYLQSDLNVLWIVQYFSLSDLIYTSLNLVFLYVLVLFFFNKIIIFNQPIKSFYRIGVLLTILCIIAIVFMEYIGVLWIFLAGLFASPAVYKETLKPNIIVVIVFIVFMPFFIGMDNFKRNISKEDIQKVALNDDERNWGILDKIGDKTLLINLDNKSEFKVISLEESKNITK